MVRETTDHGPFNSWDRQPFFVDRGGVGTFEPLRNVVTGNFMMNQENPQEAIDNDDGSAYYDTHHNFFPFSSGVLLMTSDGVRALAQPIEAAESEGRGSERCIQFRFLAHLFFLKNFPGKWPVKAGFSALLCRGSRTATCRVWGFEGAHTEKCTPALVWEPPLQG